MERTNRKISDDFKRKVVLEVMSGELSKEGARRVYDIRGKSAVSDWISRFGGDFQWLQNPVISLPAMAKDSETVEQLKAKIKELQEKLELQKHKAGLFETLIEVAEEHFKIDIRKKSGAKQSVDTKSAKKASK